MSAYYPLSHLPTSEGVYSRKVFVGGVPPNIDEDEIYTNFARYAPFQVSWPYKATLASQFPPKGFVFLIFQHEQSVRHLINCCLEDNGKFYYFVSSTTIICKRVEIKVWSNVDVDHITNGCKQVDPRMCVFVSGVPRQMKAKELSDRINNRYGGVCYAGIEIDSELKYPKGSAKVSFDNMKSYLSVIKEKFVTIHYDNVIRSLDVRPFVLSNEKCEECKGKTADREFAPYFCVNVKCLRYFCSSCWLKTHSKQWNDHRFYFK